MVYPLLILCWSSIYAWWSLEIRMPDGFLFLLTVKIGCSHDGWRTEPRLPATVTKLEMKMYFWDRLYVNSGSNSAMQHGQSMDFGMNFRSWGSSLESVKGLVRGSSEGLIKPHSLVAWSQSQGFWTTKDLGSDWSSQQLPHPVFPVFAI